MDDLISRSALIEELHQKKSIMVAEPDGKHSVSLETVIDYISKYPTVDAVPVVDVPLVNSIIDIIKKGGVNTDVN